MNAFLKRHLIRLTLVLLFQSELYFCARRAPLLAVCAVAVASYNTDAAIADDGYTLLPSITEAELEQRMVDECLEVASLVVRLSRMLLQTRSMTTLSNSGSNVDTDLNSNDSSSSSSSSSGKDEAIELVRNSRQISDCSAASPVFAVFQQQRRAAESASRIRQRLEMAESLSSSSSSSSADASDRSSDHRNRYWAWHSNHRQSLSRQESEAGHADGSDNGHSEEEITAAAHANEEDEEERFFGVSERGAQHVAMRMHLLMRLALDSHIDVLVATAESRLALSDTAGRERVRPWRMAPRVVDDDVAATAAIEAIADASAAPFLLMPNSASILIVPLNASESSSSSSIASLLAPSFALMLPAVPESLSIPSILVAPILVDVVSASASSLSSASDLSSSSTSIVDASVFFSSQRP